jgi:tartrate dehydratase beta subunit/fumarate hydratase class I family protein
MFQILRVLGVFTLSMAAPTTAIRQLSFMSGVLEQMKMVTLFGVNQVINQ